MKKIYISGPMTGLEDLNRKEFNRIECILKAKGYCVINPVSLADDLQKSGALVGLSEEDQYRALLKHDLSFVPQCDEIFMLKKWGLSEGANKEFALARMCWIEPLFQGDE